MWKMWKKGFDVWERTTADYLEAVFKNPAVLGPAGSFLTAAMKTKAATDKAVANWWGAMGLPTKRDQERTLHKLNTLESRLFDLEDKLDERFELDPSQRRARASVPTPEPQQRVP